ncbi:hypothetical protein [Pseudoalteromonas phenolica]|uniref:hypothetical protein n=1 Tax=Pseudoalteromonas phenolica TaxID=161398 RepID=UPI0007179ED4|nr:hypothetical protein [Pseudoalteromonas phenolica]MBE0356387.1 hypothetical protein [Pseudoalteromonas phenolica O-BC30]RXF06250.1 hypothetical protein D9981_01595 [Pseudoalteromonas phenolica O-BC30]
MKFSDFLLVWPAYLAFNIFVLAVVLYFALGPVLELIKGQDVTVSFIQAVCCSTLIYGARGLFAMKIEG